jgi:glutathione peroxidase
VVYYLRHLRDLRETTNFENMNTIYQFSVKSIEGSTLNFSDFKGKKILLVNTASACGLTPQYAQLQELYDNYKNQVVVVGIPANEFGAQEPGTNEEIKDFCSVRYGVSFPLAAKQVVVGEGQSDLFQWLTQKEKNGVQDAEIKWNFHKFVLDENGALVANFGSMTSPLDETILKTLGINV